ncbi:BUD13 homolog [Argonauta hians]
MASVSKAEYLKRYMSDDADRKKKRKRIKKGPRPRIFDDDVDLKSLAPDNSGNHLDDELQENLPTVAEFVDERPAEVQQMEQYQDANRWKSLGANKMEEGEIVSDKSDGEIDSDSRQPSPNPELSNSDSAASSKRPRLSDQQKRYTPSKRPPVKDDRNNAVSDHNSSSSSQEDSAPEKSSRRRLRHNLSSDKFSLHGSGSDSDHRPKPKGKSLHRSDSEQSVLSAGRHDSDSDQSGLRRGRLKSDSDQSGLRRARHDSDSNRSVPRRSRQDSDSDQSVARHGKAANKSDSDNSAPRRVRHDSNSSDSSDSDQSVQRRNRRPPSSDSSTSDSDQPAPRRRRKEYPSGGAEGGGSGGGSGSGRYNKAHATSSSLTGTGLRHHHHHREALDVSPHRSIHNNNNNNSSKKKAGGGGDSDSDLSPIRPRRRHGSTPPPPSSSSSHRRKQGTRPGAKEGEGAPRHGGARRAPGGVRPGGRETRDSGGDSDLSPPRQGRHHRGSSGSPGPRPQRTLRGVKAGLSSAADTRKEIQHMRKKEDRLFHQMDSSVSGRDAETVIRDRSTGRRRDLKQEQANKEEDQKKKAEKDAKYEAWGKGLKQMAQQQQAVQDSVYEMSKPLARYKDDKDLDQMLREKIRDGDPMLAFIKKKKKKPDKKELPTYKGPPAPPNRYNIQPGYRWDGVDRSNGYEAKLYSKLAEKKATALMAYKWSVEDM